MWWESTFDGEEIKVKWRGRGGGGGRGGRDKKKANFWLVVGLLPIPPVGKTLFINIIYIYIYYNIYIYIYVCIIHVHHVYTMKKLHVHLIHHVPKWQPYSCKIRALCVPQIYIVDTYLYMVYIYIYV